MRGRMAVSMVEMEAHLRCVSRIGERCIPNPKSKNARRRRPAPSPFAPPTRVPRAGRRCWSKELFSPGELFFADRRLSSTRTTWRRRAGRRRRSARKTPARASLLLTERKDISREVADLEACQMHALAFSWRSCASGRLCEAESEAPNKAPAMRRRVAAQKQFCSSTSGRLAERESEAQVEQGAGRRRLAFLLFRFGMQRSPIRDTQRRWASISMIPPSARAFRFPIGR